MNWDEQTINEWNQIGFYYEYDDKLKQWRFWGSKKGLNSLAELIVSYASNPANATASEHTHIGPYNYLKIMTWHEPALNSEYIGGSLENLLMLSNLISDRLHAIEVGQLFKIADEYVPNSSVNLLFIVMADDFVPSSIEFKI